MNPRALPTSTRWALALAVATLALWPAAASATPLNARSDRVALHAYRTYLQNLVSIAPAWRRADQAYVASISGRCRHVLAALKHAPPGTYSVAAVLRFGLESGGDLDVAGYPLAQPPLAKLAATLDPLHWSGAGIKASIRRFLAAEDSLTHLAQSDLCSDARALAATHGRRAAGATRRWVSRYAHRVTVAAQDGAAFRTVLERLATPADTATVTKITSLVNRWTAIVQNRLAPEGRKLLAVLGL